MLNASTEPCSSECWFAHASGVYLLGSPQMFQDIRKVTPAGVTEGLRLAKTFFPVVVVDLEDCFHEEQMVALRQADSILLVTRLDFTSLRSCRRIIEHLQELEVAPGKIRVIVSRHGQANELPVDEAEAALGQRLTQFIPEDAKTVNGANNIGIPVVTHAPNTRVAQAIAARSRVRASTGAIWNNHARDGGVLTSTSRSRDQVAGKVTSAPCHRPQTV